MTNVRAYTSKELLELAEFYGGKIPNEGQKYLIIGTVTPMLNLYLCHFLWWILM